MAETGHHHAGHPGAGPAGLSPLPSAAGQEPRVTALEQALGEERRRLSRELHDCLSQTLYAIALSARTARELLEGDAAAAAEPLDHVTSLVEDGIAEMRSLVFGLRPESLDNRGLAGALRALARTMSARYGLAIETQLSAETGAGAEAQQALYRIAREALFNAAQHADAGHVLVRLASGPGAVVLTVEDDGTGFDADGTFPGHLGLRSMRERAREAGGTLELDSSPGCGTRVRICFPVPTAGPAAGPAAAPARPLPPRISRPASPIRRLSPPPPAETGRRSCPGWSGRESARWRS
jgi:signal transduction histidine kinase